MKVPFSFWKDLVLSSNEEQRPN